MHVAMDTYSMVSKRNRKGLSLDFGSHLTRALEKSNSETRQETQRPRSTVAQLTCTGGLASSWDTERLLARQELYSPRVSRNDQRQQHSWWEAKEQLRIQTYRHPYGSGPIEILPNLYLGDETNARNISALQERGIRHVVTVAQEVDLSKLYSSISISSYLAESAQSRTTPSTWNHHSSTAILYSMPTPSSTIPTYERHAWSHNHPRFLSQIPEFVQRIHSLLHPQTDIGSNSANLTPVLVHCQCGVSRSASLVIAYVMFANPQWGFQKSLEYVRERTSGIIDPNISFISALQAWQDQLTGSAQTTKPHLLRAQSSISSFGRIRKGAQKPKLVEDGKLARLERTKSLGRQPTSNLSV